MNITKRLKKKKIIIIIIIKYPVLCTLISGVLSIRLKEIVCVYIFEANIKNQPSLFRKGVEIN